MQVKHISIHLTNIFSKHKSTSYCVVSLPTDKTSTQAIHPKILVWSSALYGYYMYTEFLVFMSSFSFSLVFNLFWNDSFRFCVDVCFPQLYEDV